MRSNAIMRIIIWSLVIVLLLGILGSVFFAVNPRRRTESIAATEVPVLLETTFPIEEIRNSDERTTFAASEVQEIKIEWVAGDILIQPNDADTISIREDGLSDERYAMILRCRDGELKIQFCDEDITKIFGVGMSTELSKDLTITVPRDWECNTLEIDAASAAVEVNDLTIREVDFDGASGACEFENCTVDEIDLDTASGDIRFIGSLDTLDCDAASASVYAVLSNTPSRMDLDTMSGDLDITLPENAGFTVSNNSLSSNFSSDFETSMKNGNHVCGDGRCRINVDALSGNVTLRKGAAAVAASQDTPSAYPYHTHSEQCLSEPNSCPDTHQHTDSCVDDSSTCPQRIASSHHHTDSCTTDPNSCPDTHTHTDNCSTDPSSCPLGGVTQHQHSDSCTTDPNSCPDTHQHTNSCIDDPDSCPSHETDTHHTTASSGVTSSSSSGSHHEE